jgi:hypothetical protein
MRKAIERSIVYEAYFDLWGYTLPIVILIQDIVLDADKVGSGDKAEAYKDPLCGVMGARFQSQDKARVDALCEKVATALKYRKRKNLTGGCK